MSNEVNAFVCSQVRRLRQERCLRVQDIAERSGIPLGSYSCLELGRYRMSLENLFRLLLVLQVEITEVWPQTIPVSGPVTAQDIHQAISEAEERLPERLTVDLLLRAVAGAHGVTVEELNNPRLQAGGLARARRLKVDKSRPLPWQPPDLQSGVSRPLRGLRQLCFASRRGVATYPDRDTQGTEPTARSDGRTSPGCADRQKRGPPDPQ